MIENGRSMLRDVVLVEQHLPAALDEVDNPYRLVCRRDFREHVADEAEDRLVARGE